MDTAVFLADLRAHDNRDDVTPDDGRRSASCLSPDTLEIPSLESSIDVLMTQVRDVTAFSTSIQFDGWEPLEDDAKTPLVLQIVCEAVCDAVMRSGTHVVVSLARRGRQCEICICDDGKAENVGEGGETRRGTMHQSARLLDGSLDTVARASGGTTIRLTFRP